MVREACNHPSLVSKDYNTDREAIESRPAPKDDQEDEELTTMFKQLGVSKGKKCQLCQDEYISLVISHFERLLTPYRLKINYREHCQRWRTL
jgi:hypothetical protein